MDVFLKNNLGLQVLTDTGWSNFDGLSLKGIQQTAELQLSTSNIRATLDHAIFTEQLEKIAVKNLKPGMRIHTIKGIQRVVSIKLADKEQVYDLLNVKNNFRFFANNILVSNCEFVIADETLIAPAKLIDLEGVEPTHKTSQVRWYKTPEKGKMYCVGLDPSLGTGGDPSAIQIFEANSTEQVGEWKHNRTTIPEQIRILADVVQYIYNIVGDEQSVYYSVENNTIGEAALISIDQYGEENIKGYFLSDPHRGPGRYRKGFNTSPKNKLTACAKLKTLIESGKMKLRSKPLISELKTFVAHGLSYAAKPGQTDDLVMATILVTRMMILLQTYHPEMDTQMRDFGESITPPLPFIASMY